MVYEFTATDETKYFFGLHLVSSDDYRYVLNAHGDVIALVSKTGSTIAKYYEYDAFGNEINPDSSDTNPYRYCGEYFDTESGTIYLRARYYSPVHGRFTQVDSARDGINWYAYCYNNPVSFVDPSGEIAVTTIILIASVAIGVAAGGYTAYQSHKTTGKIDWAASITNGLSWGMIAYTCGMSAYGVYLDYCSYYGYSPVTEVSFNGTHKLLQDAANQVKSSETGHVSGTKQHSDFKEIVDSYNSPSLKTEISYKDGQVVKYGTKGSVRLDVAEVDSNGKVVAVYDLKTGSATLTEERIAEIRKHVGNDEVQIFEIHPE